MIKVIQTYLPMDGVFMMTILTLGSLLPCVGIAILLKQVANRPIDILIFMFGFTLAAVMGCNLVAAAIIGGFMAWIYYQVKANAAKHVAVAADDDFEEEKFDEVREAPLRTVKFDDFNTITDMSLYEDENFESFVMDEEEEDDAEETERHGVAEYGGEGEDVPGTVEKDDKGVTAGGLCDFIVIIGPVFKEEIFRFPCLENPYGEVEGFFGVECGDVVDVNDLRFLFVRVKENGEISRLIGEFRCFFRPVPEFKSPFSCGARSDGIVPPFCEMMSVMDDISWCTLT